MIWMLVIAGENFKKTSPTGMVQEFACFPLHGLETLQLLHAEREV
jgi:hypothetical protein